MKSETIYSCFFLGMHLANNFLMKQLKYEMCWSMLSTHGMYGDNDDNDDAMETENHLRKNCQ